MNRATRLGAATVVAVGCLIGLILLARPAQAVTCGGQVADYTYGTDDPAYQVLTATTYSCRSGARWLITVHGGSWVNGSRATAQNAVDSFYSHGWQVFNVEYRRGAGVPWTDQRADVDAAYDWIVAHADRFGIDPTRSSAYGFSAGGHLVAWLANDRPLRAAVTVCGVLQPQRVASDDNGARPDTEPTSPAMHALHLREIDMMGGLDWDAAAPQQQWLDFMPQTGITTSTAPMFLVEGSIDDKVPPPTAAAYAYWLRRAGVPAKSALSDGYGHTSNALFGNRSLTYAVRHWITDESEPA